MTQERFLKLMNNPDLLATIPYEELKTLALTYPYVHNLRYLLALKSRQDKHADFSRNLAAAATYSLDRTRLFELIAPKSLAPQPVDMEEEIPVLELKPIETVQRELHSKTPVPRESTPTANEPAETAYVPEPGQTDQSDTAAAPEEIKAPAALQPAEDQPVPVAEEMKEMESNAPDSEQASGEKLSFGIWINQFNPPVLTPASVPTVPEQEPVMPVKEPETIPQKPEEQGSAADNSAITPQQLAEKSVTESKSIASETLAKLYADQGYTEKAIEMYERLILAIPGKSAYFAAQIEKLKK